MELSRCFRTLKIDHTESSSCDFVVITVSSRVRINLSPTLLTNSSVKSNAINSVININITIDTNNITITLSSSNTSRSMHRNNVYFCRLFLAAWFSMAALGDQQEAVLTDVVDDTALPVESVDNAAVPVECTEDAPVPMDGVEVVIVPLEGAGDAPSKVEPVEYIGAVLEYTPYSDWDAGGLAILKENARMYLDYAALAKIQEADIIVFPECGLTSINVTGGDFMSLTQVVPNPLDLAIPCDFQDITNYTQVMKTLSCGARELEMYLVVNLSEQEDCRNTTQPNPEPSHPHGYTHGREKDEVKRRIYEPLSQFKMTTENLAVSEGCLEESSDDPEGTDRSVGECPSSGYLFYNTQVVFDRSGAVVARYRKKHLYLESQYTPGTEEDTTAIFTTDFGVAFTLQVCFDIMYMDPAVNNVLERGVMDVAMSTAWIDELPFLTTPQIFNGWSTGLGVNLLVADYHDVTSGKLGSGIFRGVNSHTSDYIYDHQGGSSLLVGRVSTLGTRRAELPEDGRPRPREEEAPEGASEIHDDASRQRPPTATYYTHQTHFYTDETHKYSVGLEDPPNVSYPRDNEQNTEQTTISDDMYFMHEDLSLYNHYVLDRADANILFVKTLCHNDSLCCTVAYSYSDDDVEEGLYMLLAYSGVVKKGGGTYSMFTQVCAIVFCLSEDVMDCARIEGQNPRTSSYHTYELIGTFATPYVYPSVFTQKLTLINETVWTFNNTIVNETRNDCSIYLNDPVPDLLSLTMFGRWFERDPQESTRTV
ncbi:biotinidase-like [Homarus americanus]|uniref:biotinidase-like n=1 Tax=Homarus americanus TaxID=6706 RepID=UPI001C4878B8|nr:biotinidase-like [Homarus americanus]